MNSSHFLLCCGFFSFLLISCQTTANTRAETQGKWIGLSHHFKILETTPPKLEVYSPIKPFSLLQTLTLEEEEVSKFKKIFTRMISLNGEEALQYDEDIETVLPLLEERNKNPSSENQFELALAFEELIPQE